MKSHFRHAIQNLLNCNDFNTRIDKSRKIISYLENTVGNFGNVETALRNNLIDRLKACALFPASGQRFILLKLADFYDQNYLFETETELSAA